MKKITALLLAICIMLSLCACGATESKAEEPEEKPAAAVEAADPAEAEEEPEEEPVEEEEKIPFGTWNDCTIRVTENSDSVPFFPCDIAASELFEQTAPFYEDMTALIDSVPTEGEFIGCLDLSNGNELEFKLVDGRFTEFLTRCAAKGIGVDYVINYMKDGVHFKDISAKFSNGEHYTIKGAGQGEEEPFKYMSYSGSSSDKLTDHMWISGTWIGYGGFCMRLGIMNHGYLDIGSYSENPLNNVMSPGTPMLTLDISDAGKGQLYYNGFIIHDTDGALTYKCEFADGTLGSMNRETSFVRVSGLINGVEYTLVRSLDGSYKFSTEMDENGVYTEYCFSSDGSFESGWWSSNGKPTHIDADGNPV